jgi:hypothetical protein
MCKSCNTEPRNMPKEACAFCKQEVNPDTAIPLTVFGQRRAYHPECYEELQRRVTVFWSIMTGPEDDFEKWLKGE